MKNPFLPVLKLLLHEQIQNTTVALGYFVTGGLSGNTGLRPVWHVGDSEWSQE